MASARPRLILFPGCTTLDKQVVEALRAAFEVEIAHDLAAASDLAKRYPEALVMDCAASTAPPSGESRPPAELLRHIGEGVGVIESDGSIRWMDDRLRGYAETVRDCFVERCGDAVLDFSTRGDDTTGPASRKFSFECEGRHFEILVTPASAMGSTIGAVVGVLSDVTAGRQLLDKLDAIDVAGSELMKLEPQAIASHNASERLQLLEEKIAQYVLKLLGFDNFEIRLIDRETDRLELVMAVGIAPEKIGEVIYPEPEGSGITGYVAATGQSYLCGNVQADPLYREGLDNAASSLTVPLRLHDRTIGVFNVESPQPDAFDENDRRFAIIFGRYIAMAMNILDLLVAERYTTNEQVSRTVVDEIAEPLTSITEQVESLRREHEGDAKMQSELQGIAGSVERIKDRVERCATGPRNILGAEHELQWGEPDPVMIGKRVLVADDEPAIRSSIAALLTHKGCEITVCADGRETIDAINLATRQHTQFDLVLSDIKMPDHSGYDVFHTVKATSPHTPVILMTGFGYDPHHSIVRASQEGLHSFLFKPFKATQLIEEVGKALSSDAKARPDPAS